ncbi:TetR/AcrR family transcriptional regulator [Rhodococcus triatomae]|nr:TetR/AcrR family transcriptional regulator [Rhodococcus triatomae]QNG25485.1 TetR/AcrR family transcriptional regulator [Rhodococcus triatomae]
MPGAKKVGRKPAFTREDVVAAAIAEGIDRFRLSAVADRLGVVPAAIYRLFPSRDDLVVACLDAAGATLRMPEPGMSWRETLSLWADECWRVCEDFPGLSGLVYAYPSAFTRIEYVFAAYAANLKAQGKSTRQAMFALDFIGDSVFASHLSVESMRSVDEDGTSGLDRVRAAIGDADVVMEPQDSWTDRGAVDTKIDFILTGLERHWPEL